MKTSLQKIFHTFYSFIIPILSIIFLELIFYLPRTNSFFNILRFAPFYTGIYFWLSLRKDIFNIFSVFILGIFADVITSTTIGINLLSFLFLYIISHKMFSYFNILHFSYSWLLFTIALLISLIFKSVITSIFYQTLVPITLVTFEFVLISALYPILARFYLYSEIRFIHLEERYENQ